jgi:16S rRNA A1518/A1519 N6-dimethyltransferase RsmA/KsgA/DIM1 with predicted DNA glycosylase/AP lyase activity
VPQRNVIRRNSKNKIMKTALNKKRKTVLELCAGGGGQFLGLEDAGFECVGAVEIEEEYCKTLKYNRPKLNVLNLDLKHFSANSFLADVPALFSANILKNKEIRHLML